VKRRRRVVHTAGRGEGTIFRFEFEDGSPVSPNLYISYRADGKEHRFSALTDDLDDAKRELARLTRNRENAREGLEPLIVPAMERVTVSELLDANLVRVAEKKLASARSVGYYTNNLRRVLGAVKATSFRPEHSAIYRRKRSREGVTDTTIRKELDVLSVAFSYARRRCILRYSPYIERPSEDNIREKEIPLDKFPKILKAMVDHGDSRDAVEWLLLTAMRPSGAFVLRWSWFDSEKWTLRVPAQKGGNARMFSVSGSLRTVIERRIAARRLGCDFIFQSNGKPLRSETVREHFYLALEAVGLSAGRDGFTLYDVKRVAAGLLIDSGLTEREAMHFSGHKTPSMFDRYLIKSPERHAEQVARRDAYLAKRLADTASTGADKVAEFPKG
jgi:integrase